MGLLKKTKLRKVRSNANTDLINFVVPCLSTSARHLWADHMNMQPQSYGMNFFMLLSWPTTLMFLRNKLRHFYLENIYSYVLILILFALACILSSATDN